MRTQEEIRAYARAWYAKNRDKEKARRQKWHAVNPGKYAEYSRTRRRKFPEKLKEQQKRFLANHPGYNNPISCRWAKNNRAKRNALERARCARDPAFKLGKNLRHRLNDALRKGAARKSDRTIKLIGCDIQFFMGYLEARFRPGMKWSNYGVIWEIDHRLPCAMFDLTDESHQRSCFHYSNLQPLFTTENRRKHAKLPTPHQAELL